MNKYDTYLSEDRDFEGGPYPVRMRYLLCSSPRVGSTLLGQMLTDSCIAGDPLEYLNPNYLKAAMGRDKSVINLKSLCNFLEEKRTSPNGVFGMQIHWSHFNQFFKKNTSSMSHFFLKFDKYIFLRRRDKVAQAVSLLRASKTGLWSSLDEDQVGYGYIKDEKFEPQEIARYLNYIISQDLSWIEFFKSTNRQYMTIYYEDLNDSWDLSGRKILSHLTGRECVVPEMSLRKQRPEQDLYVDQFKEYLGL